MTCWSCYDFESAAAHEIGHILGLGHPELTPRETLGGYAATGQNAFHSHLANGISFSNVTCKSPWDGVVAGVPEHAPTDPRWSLVQVRPSIMFDFTLDHPRSCLELDDLEALNVLYPDCHVATLMDPQCIKSPLNLGWMRLALAIASFALCYAFASGALGWARYIRGDFKHARKDLRRRLGRASRAYGDGEPRSLTVRSLTMRLRYVGGRGAPAADEVQEPEPVTPQSPPLALPAPAPEVMSQRAAVNDL